MAELINAREKVELQQYVPIRSCGLLIRSFQSPEVHFLGSQQNLSFTVLDLQGTSKILEEDLVICYMVIYFCKICLQRLL